MKNKDRIYLYFLVFCTTIAITATTQNPFDAAIKQIDAQSKELNQQIISSQQDGLANQKIQRLELELTNIQAEHSQELETMKGGYENHIKELKTQIATAQRTQEDQLAACDKAKKDLEDAHQEIAQLRVELKEYSALKSHIAEAQEKISALITPVVLDANKTE